MNEMQSQATPTAAAALPVGQPSPFLSLAGVWARHRKMPIAPTFPRPQWHLTSRAMIAAPGEADLSELAASEDVEQKRTTTSLNDAVVRLRTLRSPQTSSENWLWVVILLASAISLAGALGTMERFIGN